jgi:uncharacterized coiled-coil DUF342 family protein
MNDQAKEINDQKEKIESFEKILIEIKNTFDEMIHCQKKGDESREEIDKCQKKMIESQKKIIENQKEIIKRQEKLIKDLLLHHKASSTGRLDA